jgi:hypothetical protein
MGSNNGPVGQGLENNVIRIDAASTSSYSGSGLTLNSSIGGAQTLTSRNVTFTSNKGESVFVFASSGVVTSSGNMGVSGASSRTMSVWVRLGHKASQGVMSTGANGAGTGMALATSSTVWLLGYGNSGAATTITYNANQWYYVSYVSEFISGSTHRLILYINGGLAHTAVVTSINLTNSTLRIGCDNSGSGMSGFVSRSNFYNKALTAREIQKTFWNYQSRFGL